MFEKVSKASGDSRVQKKELQVGEKNDRFEQEADKMAAQVVKNEQAGAANKVSATGAVQKKSVEEEPEDEQVQMMPLPGKPVGDVPPIQPFLGGGASTDAPAGFSDKMAGASINWQPMSPNVQAGMEQSLGADFSSVRLHTDSKAIQLSQDIGAKAFTYGQDIYFNQGQYQPGNTEGKRLLAHELTHTIQQGKGTASIQKAEGDTPATEVIDWIAIWQFNLEDDIQGFSIVGVSSTVGTRHKLPPIGITDFFPEGLYYLKKESGEGNAASYSWQDASGQPLNIATVTITLAEPGLALADRIKLEIAPVKDFVPEEQGDREEEGSAGGGSLEGTTLLSTNPPTPQRAARVVQSPFGNIDINDFQNTAPTDPFAGGALDSLGSGDTARPANPNGPGGGTIGGMHDVSSLRGGALDAEGSLEDVRESVADRINSNANRAQEALTEADFDEAVAEKNFVRGGPDRVRTATSSLSAEDRELFMKVLEHGEAAGAPMQDIEDLVARYKQLSDFEKELLKANMDLDTKGIEFADYQEKVRLALESGEIPEGNPAHASYSQAKMVMAQINSRVAQQTNGGARSVEIPWHPFLTEVIMLSGLASGAMSRSDSIADLASEIFQNMDSIQTRAAIMMMEAARDALIGVAVGMVTFGGGAVYGSARMARKLRKLAKILEKAEAAYSVYQEIREVYNLVRSTDVTEKLAQYQQKKEELAQLYEAAENLEEEELIRQYGENFDQRLSNLEDTILQTVYDVVLDSGLLQYLYLPEEATQDAASAVAAIMDLVEGIPAGIEAMNEMVQAYHNVDSSNPSDEQLGTLSVRALRTGSRFYPLVGLLLELVNQKLDNVIAEIDDRDILDTLMSGGSRRSRRRRRNGVGDRRQNRNHNEEQVRRADTRSYDYDTPDVRTFLRRQAAPLFKEYVDESRVGTIGPRGLIPASVYPLFIRKLRTLINQEFRKRTVTAKNDRTKRMEGNAPVPNIRVESLSAANEDFRIAINPNVMVDNNLLLGRSPQSLARDIQLAFTSGDDVISLPVSYAGLESYLGTFNDPKTEKGRKAIKALIDNRSRGYFQLIMDSLGINYHIQAHKGYGNGNAMRLRDNSSRNFLHISRSGTVRKGIDVHAISHFINRDRIVSSEDLPEGYILENGLVVTRTDVPSHLIYGGASLPELEIDRGGLLQYKTGQPNEYRMLHLENEAISYGGRIVVVINGPRIGNMGFYKRTGGGGASGGANAGDWVPFWGVAPIYENSETSSSQTKAYLNHLPKRYHPSHPDMYIYLDNGDGVPTDWFNKLKSSTMTQGFEIDRYGTPELFAAGGWCNRNLQLRNVKTAANFKSVNRLLRKYNAPFETVEESLRGMNQPDHPFSIVHDPYVTMT